MTRSIRLIFPSLRALVTALALAAVQTPAASAEEPPVYMVEGLALAGYDVVTYFTESRPVTGKRAHALKWRGAIWLFSSPETQMAFEMNPRAYMPRFGGYCAFAMSQGRLVAADPMAFTIHDGRLYLAHTPDLMARWRADPTGFIRAARAEWPAVLGR